MTSDGGNLLPPVAIEESTTAIPNVIDRFIRDSIEPLEGAPIQARELYAAFADWCLRSGQEPISETAFGRAMGRRVKKDRVSRIHRYLDIQIRACAMTAR